MTGSLLLDALLVAALAALFVAAGAGRALMSDLERDESIQR